MAAARAHIAVLVAGVIALLAGGARAGDVAEGRILYQTECAYCHFSAELPLHGGGATGLSPIPVMMATYGPKLIGIVGRAAASDPSFNYSDAFLAQTRGLVWTEQTLDRFMTDAREMIPGTRMFYRQPDAAVRRKLLAYLETTG